MAKEKDIHKNHRKRLRERLERDGAMSFEPHELLELFLFDVIPRSNTNPTAHRLLDKFGSLYGVFTAPKDELIKVRGIGERSADYILQVAKDFKSSAENEFTSLPMTSYERAANYLIWHTLEHSEEMITSIMTDNELRIIKTTDYSASEISSTLKNIAQDCMNSGAARLILGYSGDESKIDELKSGVGIFDKCGIVLCDVIIHNGFDVRSLEL